MGWFLFTFRLADSIPEWVRAAWREGDQLWYRANGLSPDMTELEWAAAYRRISPREREQLERRQARRLFAETDKGHGCCLLRCSQAQAILTDAMRHFDGSRCHVGDFVIMPNHVHGLMKPAVPFEVETLLGSLKRWTSAHVDDAVPCRGRLWQSENHDRIVRDQAELMRIRRYIEENPAKAGLRKDEYAYWRAEWLDLEVDEQGVSSAGPRDRSPASPKTGREEGVARASERVFSSHRRRAREARPTGDGGEGAAVYGSLGLLCAEDAWSSFDDGAS